MTRGLFILLFAFSLTFCASAAALAASEPVWDFDDPRDLSSWRVRGSVKLDQGRLIFSGDGPYKMTSLGRLDLVSDGKVLGLSISSPTDSFGVLRLKIPGGVLLKNFFLKGGPSPQDYSFHLSNLLPSGSRIEALSLVFLIEETGLAIERVALERAGGGWWSAFWESDTTSLHMINYAPSPKLFGLKFLPALYIFILILFGVVLVVSIKEKKPLAGRPLVMALGIAFLIPALLFTMRMDFRWLKLHAQDSAVLSDDDDAIFLLYDEHMREFREFMTLVGESVPEGEGVRAASAEYHYAGLGRYLLLPLRSTPRARYIWSFAGDSVRFDPVRSVLVGREGGVSGPVELVVTGKGGGALFRLMERGEG